MSTWKSMRIDSVFYSFLFQIVFLLVFVSVHHFVFLRPDFWHSGFRRHWYTLLILWCSKRQQKNKKRHEGDQEQSYDDQEKKIRVQLQYSWSISSERTKSTDATNSTNHPQHIEKQNKKRESSLKSIIKTLYR